jgi:hypothetical protein
MFHIRESRATLGEKIRQTGVGIRTCQLMQAYLILVGYMGTPKGKCQVLDLHQQNNSGLHRSGLSTNVDKSGLSTVNKDSHAQFQLWGSFSI